MQGQLCDKYEEPLVVECVEIATPPTHPLIERAYEECELTSRDVLIETVVLTESPHIRDLYLIELLLQLSKELLLLCLVGCIGVTRP